MKKCLIKVFAIFISLLVISSFFIHRMQVNAQVQNSHTKELLSLMTDDECLDFIIQNNIEIPSGLEDETKLKSFVKHIINAVESNPEYNCVYNFDKTQKFAEDIKKLVNDYYEISVNNDISYLSSTSSYQLQYNYVYGDGEWKVNGGDWLEKWGNYNCYAYSINRSENPSHYATGFQYQPGDFARINGYYYGIQIDDLADIIKADLEAIGLTNVSISDSIPASLNSNQKLICVRTGYTDYHFMRYDPVTDAWYHKPGQTAVLKYKYIPSNNLDWISEYSLEGEEFYSGFVYNSSIKYIVYDIDRLLLSCHTSAKTINKNISDGKDFIYEMNVECAKSYKIVSSSSDAIEMHLYDNDMNLLNVTPTMSNNNHVGTLTTYLNPGTYYLRLNYVDSSSSGNIVTTYQTTWPSDGVQVICNSSTATNILPHLHLINESTYCSRLYFINDKGAGYYKFSLNAGINAIYPEGAIKIYTDSYRISILDRYQVDNLSVPAISNENENELYVYLPEKGYYYINVMLPTNNYSRLTFRIDEVEKNNINYQDRLDFICFDELFYNNKYISYFEEVTISHRSKIELDVTTSGAVNENIPVYIFAKCRELGFEPGDNHYYIVSKLIDNITSTNRGPIFTVTLDAGTYYMGYSDNFDNVGISFALRRKVNTDLNINGTLVTDPAYDQGFPLGSEVTFNNGALLGSTITAGFTRNIYLMVEDRLKEQISRLEYDWYSSNENVARVTEYGTVLALNVTENTPVTIYAINKNDPSIVYKKDFTILKETKTDPIIIECNMSYSYSRQNGKYKLELDFTNSPYPYIVYYVWAIECLDGISIDMNAFGIITSTGTGEAIITANYTLNRRVFLNIHLTITE